MGNVYFDGWGRLTVETDDPGVGFENAYRMAREFLLANHMDWEPFLVLVPCGINKFCEPN